MSIDYVVNFIMVQKLISENNQKSALIEKIAFRDLKSSSEQTFMQMGNRYHTERTVIKENGEKDFFVQYADSAQKRSLFVVCNSNHIIKEGQIIVYTDKVENLKSQCHRKIF